MQLLMALLITLYDGPILRSCEVYYRARVIKVQGINFSDKVSFFLGTRNLALCI